MTASRCAAARSTRACHSSALHSWRLMRETWNCMANLLADVVSVSLAAAPRGIRQTRGKTAEPTYQRHRALLRPHAYRPRRGHATEKGTRDVSIDRIAFGPSPARAGLQVTQISRVNSGWRNDFATLSAACTQPAYGATKHDGRFLATPYPHRHDANASSKTLACFRSSVSKPSVNQP